MPKSSMTSKKLDHEDFEDQTGQSRLGQAKNFNDLLPVRVVRPKIGDTRLPERRLDPVGLIVQPVN